MWFEGKSVCYFGVNRRSRALAISSIFPKLRSVSISDSTTTALNLYAE